MITDIKVFPLKLRWSQMKIIFEGKSFIFICHDRDKGISFKIAGITQIFSFYRKNSWDSPNFLFSGGIQKKFENSILPWVCIFICDDWFTFDDSLSSFVMTNFFCDHFFFKKLDSFWVLVNIFENEKNWRDFFITVHPSPALYLREF